MQNTLPSHPATRPIGAKPVRFGSPMGLMGGSMPGLLPMMERHPLAELVFKDITAFNAPKITLARSWKERLDTATLELSNTAITLFSSLFLPRLLRHPVSKLSGVSIADLKKEIPYAAQNKTAQAVKLARLGTSFSFFFPFAAAFWAAPFFRNWLTLKRTNSANFEDMIGFQGVQKNTRTPQEEMAVQKKKAWQVFGTGLALGAASLLGFSAAAKGIANKEGKALWQGLSAKMNGQ